MTSELKLTPIQECLEDLDELKDTTTSGLVSYGLRSGCLDSEYHLALRLEELRKLALTLVEQSLAEGGAISDSTLKLIDIQRVETITKRFATFQKI